MKLKESFKFYINEPYFDWFKTKEIVIEPEEYAWFELQRRFDSTWYLMGLNKDKVTGKLESKEIGVLGRENRNVVVKEFIEWSGNKLIKITSIGGGINLIKSIKVLLEV